MTVEDSNGTATKGWHFAIVPVAVIFVIGFLCLAFHKAQMIGGETWDEAGHRIGIVEQIEVARRWIGGDGSAHFSQVTRDYEFYGIVAVLPAYLTEIFLKYWGKTDVAGAYRYALHLTAFCGYFLTLIFSYLILVRTTPKKIDAAIGIGLIAVFPLWLGFSFFDYKDVPTAAFMMMGIYAAIGFLQSNGDHRSACRFAQVLAFATILIAGLKIPALILVVPSWIAALCVLIKRRQFAILIGMGALSTIGIFAITPVAWTDPLNFLASNIKQVSQNPWGQCTHIYGTCVGTSSAEWSVAQYLLAWFSAQVPILVILGFFGGLIISLRKGSVMWTISASAILPLAIIIALNSTLYNGLRHVLFEIPIIFVISTIFWSDIGRRYGSTIIRALGVALIGLFIWDNTAMFPYNYVYFNLPARQVADETNTATDLWGFSLKEASGLRVATSLNGTIIGIPAHLVRPFVSTKRQVATIENLMKLPSSSEISLISYTAHGFKLPDWCKEAEYITRQLPMGGRPLRLSFAARCITPEGSIW